MSLNPNCSETVYRFKRDDIEYLPGGMEFIERMIDNYWGSLEPVPGYSSLRPRNDTDICVYFYQTSCGELENALLSRNIKYKAEKPFTSDINTPEEFIYESK